MTWEQELQATRRKVEALGGAGMSSHAIAILNEIDRLLIELSKEMETGLSD